REKWERRDYRERTIAAAIASTNEVYEGASRQRPSAGRVGSDVSGERVERARPKVSNRRLRLRALSEVQPRRVRWLVPGQIPLRFPPRVAGVGGLGKSTWLLARAAEGSVAPEPWDTIYVSFEDTAEEVLRPRVEAAGGDLDRVHELVLADVDSLE